MLIAAFASRAATVSTDAEGNTVIDVAEGETNTYSTAIAGAGTIKGGAVTLRDGFRAHAEDLNANQGLSVDNALTFADGAKVTVDDLANVSSGRAKWPLVTATSAIVGTPTLDTDVLPSPYGLKFSDDRKTLYLVCPRGTALILR